MTTLAEILTSTTGSLHPYSDTPRLDAELLITHALDIPKTRLYTHPEQVLTDKQLSDIQELAEKRREGQPIAYLIGYRYFWNLKLKVTPQTLIPRPETELLVETALSLYPANTAIEVIDLGTGSGAIALSLANERPLWQLTATDQALETLAVARENAQQNRLDKIVFIHSHWFDRIPVEARFDMIISNPPYVPQDAPHLQARGVRFEPKRALQSGPDGLDDIRILVPGSRPFLKTGGWLLLEHGFDQGEKVRSLFAEHGYRNISQKQDLGGHTRITYGQK